MSKWQPIETAPKDGTYVFLWDAAPYMPRGGRMVTGSFRVDSGFSGNKKKLWLRDDYDDYSTGYASTPLNPTHWMPLPEPPDDPRYTLTEAGERSLSEAKRKAVLRGEK